MSNLRYPGDPNGSAKEVINCHCYLQVGVLIKDEQMTDGEKADGAPTAETGQESERVTKSREYAVDSKLLQSRAYADKFDRMTDDPQEKREFLKAAKEILQHRSGQNGEDLYLYNRTTKQWTKSTTGKEAATPEYTDEIKSAIKKAKKGELIAFHNHPASMPPSDDDLNMVIKNGYAVGYVFCHNGKIYSYTAPQRPISKILYDLKVANYKQKPYNYSEEKAQKRVLSEIEKDFGFSLKEVK